MATSKRSRKNPRILIVTPEITYLPPGMGNMANRLKAKAGGLADVSASLVSALYELGADVHVALPHYRRMFNVDIGRFINNELRVYKKILPESRLHLAQDRVFFYRDSVYSNYHAESHKVAVAFLREVINNIVPAVNPDLIHCNDWMTGLIPAFARRLGIPSLFTVHNIHTHEISLSTIEDSGIDAAEFWNHLYYTRPPANYEESRDNNPVDLLASGIFAAHFVNTVSPTFLKEVCHGQHAFVPHGVRTELQQKHNSSCAFGILNAPDPSFNPASDTLLEANFDATSHMHGKRHNKVRLQQRLGLNHDPQAPLFFWPSRLDPIQKGCQLLAEILYELISSYWDDGLQLVMVANGPYQEIFHQIVKRHDFCKRITVCDFDEELSHLTYAASDFLLMPSLFEPCGLPQMIGMLYGSLPIVNDTGGLHDTVVPLSDDSTNGNGFAFRVYNSRGLRWAIEQAVLFYHQPEQERNQHITRIMQQSADRFNHRVTAQEYFDLYEKMLMRPLINTY